MAREVQDHFFRLAKKEGYLSRAAYKLIEIDDRRKLLRKGDRVLDCGAAPGSWLQVAARRVGPQGRVIGIDLKPITHRFAEPTVRAIAGDFISMPREQLLGGLDAFDVILSDMAPTTTGVPMADHHVSVRLCDALLDRCPELLRPGGNLCMKVFEGEAYPDLLARTKSLFENVKGFKPKASRGESREMYIIATGFRQ
jgi:23S rRNA (uridine2552-2'-O)-methyltransferase